jgi:hypothetical protein
MSGADAVHPHSVSGTEFDPVADYGYGCLRCPRDDCQGILPRAECDWTRLVVGSTYGGCFVCGKATSPATMTVECYRANVGFTLHPDCYVMWEEARKLDT